LLWYLVGGRGHVHHLLVVLKLDVTEGNFLLDP
jgi:hypothetical protein